MFEKRIGDLRTDFTVLANETAALSHKFGELRDSVASKMSTVPGVLQSLQESADAIARLEKHSVALLGWKVGVDQDFFEVAYVCVVVCGGSGRITMPRADQTMTLLATGDPDRR